MTAAATAAAATAAAATATAAGTSSHCPPASGSASSASQAPAPPAGSVGDFAFYESRGAPAVACVTRETAGRTGHFAVPARAPLSAQLLTRRSGWATPEG